MYSHVFSLARLALVTFFLLSFSSAVSAGPQQPVIPEVHNKSPLRVYFDVNIGLAQKLETRLMLINKTYDQLLKQGRRPEFIVGFRCTASYFVTKGDYYVEPEDLAFQKKIHQWLKTLKNKGIRMEQCLIAAEFVDIEPEDFLSEVELVDNGYVSMIVYQNQGFAQISMD